MAVTATATAAVQREIITILETPRSVVFRDSVNRKNITYSVLEKVGYIH
jgi:superfamily II DNA helicase RecQ